MQAVTTIGLDIAKSVFQVHRRGRQGDHPPPTEAPLRPGVLREAAAVPGWGRGLRHVASLVAATQAPPEKLSYVASFDPTRKTSRRHGGG
jgi:hypothetical protein